MNSQRKWIAPEENLSCHMALTGKRKLCSSSEWLCRTTGRRKNTVWCKLILCPLWQWLLWCSKLKLGFGMSSLRGNFSKTTRKQSQSLRIWQELHTANLFGMEIIICPLAIQRLPRSWMRRRKPSIVIQQSYPPRSFNRVPFRILLH